ncbi:TPA: recombinase family protein [Klebsiella pneumoniae]|uniref:recombinase family protein n=1 Tax=Enterobacteriaceae TaxID=543 RepID=UPI001EFAD7EA|nr:MULTISPECIES: recombinase family protein [Enterobacteriaceae]HDS9479984.1 recombinase family protein [Klebsiella pneumoniae subsp. pneumoniae]MCQ4354752.1 recombinase family protein [Enterobacter kobei]MCQ4376263.1 recombinase family protein [Enterobacter kobei]HBR0174666.1 recombinase family protein [Klebsiella pneumoniae]HBS6126524.1 recombinase family protein [Klebsiella pneumoniae]
MTSSRIYAYLRASTTEQDASRAKESLEKFASEHGYTIDAEFIENESGASLKRPELFNLLKVAQRGDVLLVEQVDRLSRLKSEDWNTLRQMISSKGIKVVALDLPTSHMLMSAGGEFTERMFEAVNSMMLDMLAAIAHKDYTDRQRRQAEGIKKAKEQGAYKGRPVNEKLHKQILALREAGRSYSQIQELTGAARTTISKVLNGKNGSIDPSS